MSNLLSNVNRRQLATNTQRVAYRLLNANGEWVSRKQLETMVTSATARVRDLRKPQFGGFKVQCASAAELGKRGDNHTFFYRIPPRSVRKSQVTQIFQR